MTVYVCVCVLKLSVLSLRLGTIVFLPESNNSTHQKKSWNMYCKAWAIASYLSSHAVVILQCWTGTWMHAYVAVDLFPVNMSEAAVYHEMWNGYVTHAAGCVLLALNYPKAILSRAMNYETKEMFTYVSSLSLLSHVVKVILQQIYHLRHYYKNATSCLTVIFTSFYLAKVCRIFVFYFKGCLPDSKDV